MCASYILYNNNEESNVYTTCFVGYVPCVTIAKGSQARACFLKLCGVWLVTNPFFCFFYFRFQTPCPLMHFKELGMHTQLFQPPSCSSTTKWWNQRPTIGLIYETQQPMRYQLIPYVAYYVNVLCSMTSLIHTGNHTSSQGNQRWDGNSCGSCQSSLQDMVQNFNSH